MWKFVFIAPVPRTFSVSFHFGHDGIVQLGQAVCGSPHHLRIAPFDSPFGQYISYPHVLCLPFFTQRPFAPLLGHRFATRCRSGDTHGHCPLLCYYGLIRLLLSHTRTRLRALRVRLAPKVPFELRSSVHSCEVSRVPLLNFPDTRSSYAPRGRLRVASRSPSATCPPLRSGAFRFDHPSRFDGLLLASW